MREVDYGDRKPLLKFISKEIKMTKYIDRYYLNGELYGIKFAEPGWQPWANTLLYVPMDTDLLDHWPNNITVTNSWDVSVGAVWWLSAGYFSTNSSYLSAPIDNYISAAPFTVSCWVYWNWTYFAENTTSVFWMYLSWPYRWACVQNSNNWLRSERLGSWRIETYEYLTVNTWNHLVLTLTDSESVLYLNWTAIWNISWTWNSTFENFFIGRDWDNSNRCWSWYLSNFIIESTAWTSQEVSDYFNQTKSLYGIS